MTSTARTASTVTSTVTATRTGSRGSAVRGVALSTLVVLAVLAVALPTYRRLLPLPQTR